MGIYRGFGGTGDSSSNTALSEVAALGQEVLAAQAVVAVLVTEAETAQAAAEAAQALAETAQTAAELAETNAETAETNAETAETNAETAQTAAEAAQTAAEAAQAAATASQSAAATSASNASSSASAASSSASAASTSASNAATSASNASTSASSAATAQAAAEAAQAAAEDVFTQFGDQYLGAFASDPTLDNSGNALTTGDIYFNTTDNVLKFYSGAAWVAPEDVATTAATAAANSATAASTSATNAANSATAAAASATEAAATLASKVSKTGDTGSAVIPTGTTGQRDGSPTSGFFRFNTTLGKFEGYSGTAWGAVGGGATGGGSDAVFVENDQAVTASYTIPATKNAMSTGPVTINSGVTVTVSSGARYVVI